MLRPWVAADADTVASAALDPAMTIWNPLWSPADPIPTTSSERLVLAQEWVRRRADWSDGSHASWAVAAATDPAVVLGSVSLHHIDPVQADAEIGFWVVPERRGEGVARLAVLLATEFGFSSLDLSRIALFHAVSNPASCRVALACGYLLEGNHRGSFRYGDGKHHDEHSHARLRSDPPPALR